MSGLYKGRPAYKLADRFLATLPDVADRIDVRNRLAHEDYISLVTAADAILDPMHYGGGMTTFESLALGKPVVTLPGEFAISRVAASFYRRMGITDCIASDADQYADVAVRLGVDQDVDSAAVGQTAARGAIAVGFAAVGNGLIIHVDVADQVVFAIAAVHVVVEGVDRAVAAVAVVHAAPKGCNVEFDVAIRLFFAVKWPPTRKCRAAGRNGSGWESNPPVAARTATQRL